MLYACFIAERIIKQEASRRLTSLESFYHTYIKQLLLLTIDLRFSPLMINKLQYSIRHYKVHSHKHP